jgi:SAM-dependent methyltransferase
MEWTEMLLDPMELHGRALLDYFTGARDAAMILQRDDGYAYPPLAVRDWFYEDGFPRIDRLALERCRGLVLDVGAGSGSHSLALQERGSDVISLEVSGSAVDVMKRRRVRRAVAGDVMSIQLMPVDTILLLGNIGIAGSLEGLEPLLDRIRELLKPGGQLIADSIDPRNEEDSVYVAYRRRKVAQGCYEGERTLRFEYAGELSRWFEWMHVAFDPLSQQAQRAGFTCEQIVRESRRFLCVLEPTA